MHKISEHRTVDILYQLGQVKDRLFNYSVHLSSVVKRLAKVQAQELDHHLLAIAEREKPTSVRGMYYMAMGADLN